MPKLPISVKNTSQRCSEPFLVSQLAVPLEQRADAIDSPGAATPLLKALAQLDLLL